MAKEEVIGIGSTDSAREKIKEAGLKVLEHGTIPGIPGILLNEGSMIRARCNCNNFLHQMEKVQILNQVHRFVLQCHN